MGGKTAQTSSQVQIPAEVLARYNSVNATAEKAAAQPFQQYSTDPNAFVAPINQQQSAGIDTINQAAGSYAPYYGAATDSILGAQGLGAGYNAEAANTARDAYGAASPYYSQAANTINGGLSAGQGLGNQSLATLQGGANAAAPLQQQAASGLNAAYNGAQPFNMAAAGLTGASAGAVNPGELETNRYLSPYLNTVLQGTLAPVLQQQGIDRSTLHGNQIKNGSFGGDRGNISDSVLQGQQNMAVGNITAGILGPAYENAVATAQQQQGMGLGAAQANRAALGQAGSQFANIGNQVYGQGTGTAQAKAGLGQQLYGQGLASSQQQAGVGQQMFEQGVGGGQAQAGIGQGIYGMGSNLSQILSGIGQAGYGMGSGTAQTLAGIGSGIQGAGLAGGQAQVGAGTLQQQTGQAGLSALYNQFQQEQGYPFQVAQFLANIAEGTGALSGSTTTSTQPVMGFLSDERAKEDMEPIGKTFEGQNIYKYRYKGGDQRKQIGLSAQETEHFHPEAVGEAGGLKTVDYDKATSSGGLVANDNAGEGFAAGGVPGFDLGSILQSQQGMYAPIGSGRGYGASIPNNAATHTLMKADAPKIAPMNVGKTIDDAGKLAEVGKGLFNKVDGWMGDGPTDGIGLGGGADLSGVADASEDELAELLGNSFADGGQVEEEPYPLANTYASYLAQQKMHPFSGDGLYGNPLIAQGVGGPYSTMLENPNSNLRILAADAPKAVKAELHDPSHDSAASLSKALSLARRKAGLIADDDDGQWRGGRQARALGGTSMNMPYSQNGTGYVPEQVEPTRTLAVPEQPKGQSGGSGLGDLASLAKIGMMFLKDGGRAGYADGGAPSILDLIRGPQAADNGLESPSVLDLVRAPDMPDHADARYQSASVPIAKGDFDRAPSASVAIPAGLFSDSKGDPRVLPPEQQRATHAPRGLVPTPTPRPSLPEDEMAARLPAGLSPANVNTNIPTSGLGAQTPDIGPVEERGFMDRAGDSISDAYHSLGLGGPKRDFEGATPSSGKNSDFMSRNQDWMIPLIKGIGSATLYPGKDPLGALTYGAMQGAESYADIQNQMAERNQVGAETQQTQANVFQTLQRNAPPGWQVVPGKGPNAFVGPDGKSYHYVNKTDFYGNADGANNGIAAYSTAPRENALEMDYKTGTPSIGPTAKTDQYLARTFKGFVPGDDPVKNKTRILALNPALEGRDKMDTEIAKGVIGDPQTVDMAHRQLVQLADAINTLPATGVTGRGSGFEGRQEWANLYNTARRFIGLGDDPTITADLTSGDIIKKIQAMTATTMADQTGQHSADIANVLRSVLPGGSGQIGSSNEILSSMMVQNQRQRDFVQYYDQYVGRNGISAGVNDAFNRDMGQRYADEQKQVSHLFAKSPGGRSLYELIQEDPNRIIKIENGYTDGRGNYHPGIGTGISRYLR